MRTSISLDDNLGKAARRRARLEGLSLSALVAKALERLLTERPVMEKAPPFTLITVGGPGPQPGVDLDRPSSLLLGDDEVAFGSTSARGFAAAKGEEASGDAPS